MTTPIRVSWAVMNPTVPLGKIQLVDARHALGAAFMSGADAVAKRGGLLPSPGVSAAVTATSPTPDSNVRVAPFQVVLPSSRAIAGAISAPPYLATNDRSVVFNAFATPPSAVANRRDLIILQQNDSSQGDADSNANLRYIVGNAPAADPAISGSADYVILAQVVVRQNATSVLQTDITSRLPAGYLTTAVGGILPVATQALRDAIPAWAGLTVDRTDKGWQERYDGAAWRVIGVPIVSTVASLVDITNPLTGQLAFVTATNLAYRYTGAAWVVIDQPFCHVRQTAAQNLTELVATAVNFQADYIDTFGMHPTSGNITRITPTVPGWYELHGQVAVVNTAAGSWLAGFRKNGAAVSGVPYSRGQAVNQPLAHNTLRATATIDFNGTTDYAELWTTQQFGATTATVVVTTGNERVESYATAKRVAAL